MATSFYRKAIDDTESLDARWNALKRMKKRPENTRHRYIPEIHTKAGITLTLAEKVYLARYVHVDGEASMAAALERPTTTISGQIQSMKKNGDWDLYRSLSDEEYERIILTAERREKNEEGL